jgi:hypothetical protein
VSSRAVRSSSSTTATSDALPRATRAWPSIWEPVAAERPDTLVIGVDANAAGMAESSRRAARRGALPNALFAVAAAEHPP